MFPIAAILDIGSKILERVIPDKTARDAAQAELLKAAQSNDFQLALGQIEINKVEAQSSNLFVSGWRPACGWICVVALSYNFLVYPLLLWAVAVYHIQMTPPPLFSENLMELVLGMLGLGGLRTYEKVSGVSK